MKTISLLKAALSQDMSLFKYRAKRNSSKFKKILFPVFLFILVSFSIGIYAYMIAEKLAPFNLTYVMLSMFIIMVTMLTFIGDIYKSKSIIKFNVYIINTYYICIFCILVLNNIVKN